MQIGDIIFLSVFLPLIILAMSLIILEKFKPKGKCRTCSAHLNPDEGLYCSIIHNSPSLRKSLFCRDKI